MKIPASDFTRSGLVVKRNDVEGGQPRHTREKQEHPPAQRKLSAPRPGERSPQVRGGRIDIYV